MKSSEIFPTLLKVYETVAPFKLQANPSSHLRFTSLCPVCGDPSKSKLQYSMQTSTAPITICCTAKCNREFTLDEIVDAAKARLNQSIKPATDTPKVESISIASIEVNTSAQSRAEIDMALVAEYAESMREGAVFPPMTVFNDGSIHWLSEGFHRYHAYKEAGIAECSCIVKQGGLREAILKSLGSNVDHGKRRTNADKKRAVELMLADSEWSAWSDREIAKQCAVSHEFVRQSRVICQPLTDTIEPDDRPSEKVRTATRGGKTYTVNTAKIGKPKADNSKKIIKHAIDKVFAEMNGALSDEDGIDLAVNYVLAEINGSIDKKETAESVVSTTQEPEEKPKSDIGVIQELDTAPSKPIIPAVRIDTGAVSAMDDPESLPIEKWDQLIRARYRYLAINLPSDCSYLLQFIHEADKLRMWEKVTHVDMATGDRRSYKDINDFICNAFELDHRIIQWSIDGWKMLKPSKPVPFEVKTECVELPSNNQDEELEKLRCRVAYLESKIRDVYDGKATISIYGDNDDIAFDTRLEGDAE